MLGKGDKILLSTGNFNDTYLGKSKYTPITGNEIPEQFLIEAPFSGDKVTLRITNNILINEVDIARGAPKPESTAKPAYIRLSGDLELVVPLAEERKIVKGKIIHEICSLEFKKLNVKGGD